MARVPGYIAACVVMLATHALPALADQSCKPVVGQFEALQVPAGTGHCPQVPGVDVFCTAGRVWGGIQGSYEFVMTSALPAAELGGTSSVLFFVGQSTVFLKTGDRVLGTDTGSIDVTGAGGFASLITFDGGTGGMAGVSGHIRLRGEVTATGTSGDYIGTLCMP